MAKRVLSGWGDILIGVAMGAALTLTALAVINYAHGWQRVGAWHRALDQRQAETLERLTLEQIEVARATVADGDPSDLGARLASSVFPELYSYYLDYARFLLENHHVESFNQLRAGTGFAVLDLSGADLSGLDLQEANFSSAVLDRVDLRRAHLDGASFFRARLAGADFSEARVNGTSFAQAEMDGARLNGLIGSEVDFRQVVLVDASMTGVHDLVGARFDSAILAQSNFHASSFPEAVFDHADMTVASAVGCDFSRAASMNAVVLSGANLAGARLNPDNTSRLWLHNAEGLSSESLASLRQRDCVDRPEDLLHLVDSRIVAGFRAQLEGNPEVLPGDRDSLLLDLLRQYWMQ